MSTSHKSLFNFASRPSECFLYKPLDPALKEIRVLIVEPGGSDAPVRASVRHVSLVATPKPQYEAVSYAWGDRFARAEVILDERTISVPRSSEEALRSLRSRAIRMTLWIDALCIDQTNIDERNYQVALMKTIYLNASCTRVWLGQSDELTSLAFLHLDRLLEQMRRETKDLSELSRMLFGASGDFVQANPPIPLTEDAIIVIRGIIRRPWFSRVWVIQEASLPPRCLCHCGKLITPMLDILRVAAWIWHKFYYSDLEVIYNFTSIENAFNIWDRADHEHGRAATLKRSDFTFVIGICSNSFQASDPRDHIFALLGLATFTADSAYVPPPAYT